MSHKKPYQKPELIVHGNVEQITQVLDGGIGDLLRVDRNTRPIPPRGGGSRPRPRPRNGS